MSIGVTAGGGRANRYQVQRIPLDKVAKLKFFSQRNDIRALKVKDFKARCRALRNNPESEIYLLSLADQQILLLLVANSLFKAQTYIDILLLSELAKQAEVEAALAEFIYKQSLNEVIINSPFSLKLDGLTKVFKALEGSFLYHSYKENFNPEQNRIIRRGEWYLVMRFNRSADALTGLYLLAEGQSCPELLQPIFEAQGLLNQAGKIQLLPNYCDQRRRLEPLQSQVETEITEYLSGNRQDFNLPYELPVDAGEFQLKVWQELAKIPYGSYCTYEEIARRIVDPAEANKYGRAVGAACSANPLMLILPCHRVLGQGGELRGFMTGVKTKAWLLDHELLRYR
ncbi:MAG: methylated-DNA--[protein]-cysteine S-methyltransferase [Eubacteriales bacterium]|nr:methylated-DNA--[protein]-cysteine S-methyltransferase [Eubacteriales bacterium]